MISKRDNEILRKAMDEFLIKVNESFTGDDIRPSFELRIRFFASGYEDLSKELSKAFNIDMLNLRRF